MEKTAAHQSTPPKSSTGEDTRAAVNQKAVFFAAVLDMTWQMAIVVVVPIVGGFKLDELWHTTPYLTIVGFVLAMIGFFLVMRRMVRSADARFAPKEDKR